MNCDNFLEPREIFTLSRFKMMRLHTTDLWNYTVCRKFSNKLFSLGATRYEILVIYMTSYFQIGKGLFYYIEDLCFRKTSASTAVLIFV
jgi:hypothetical protein